MLLMPQNVAHLEKKIFTIKILVQMVLDSDIVNFMVPKDYVL